MFSSPYLAGSFSLCLRCQHRLVKYPQRQLRRPSLKQSHGQSRYLCHSQSLAEREVRHEEDDLDNLFPQSKSPPGIAASHVTLGPKAKRIDIYTKDDLGIESLGKPAKALVLRTAERDENTTFYTRESDKPDAADELSGVGDILNTIQAEIGIASASGVAKGLVDLREAWATRRKFKARPPTAEECQDLVQRIRRGFYVRQLHGYYCEGHVPAPDSYNIELPYSSTAYARSAWTEGSTPFPGDAHSRCQSARLSAEARVSAEPLTFLKLRNPKVRSKRALIERVLWDRWGIRHRQDEEASGELEIWLPYEHVCLLMDHSQDILRRLSRRTGAKIDASKSHQFLRMTGDRGTCADALDCLLSEVQCIEAAEIELKSGQEAIGGEFARSHPRGTAFWEELQQLTNTVITPIPSSDKVVVYYLGPSKQDLTDARRLLLQSEYPLENRSVSAHWGGTFQNVRAAASPVEIGIRLPLADRGLEWSRWAFPVERKKPAVAHDVSRKAVKLALRSQKIHDDLRADVSHEELGFWPNSTQQSSSATIGHILYPKNIVKNLKIINHAEAGGTIASRFIKKINSPHQFLGINLGLRSFPLGNDSGKLVWNDELRIYLTPKTGEVQSEQPTVPLPELEIRITINQVQRTTKLGSVRLIFERREADLLMPGQPADMRFSTEMYATANNLNDVPQELSEFLASSNLNVWGTDRLKTPPGLRLPTPRYSIPEASVTRTAIPQASPSPNHVDYTFASLEHRSGLVELWRDYNLVYSVIEAGRTGGRREELSVMAHKTGSENQGINLYEVAQKIIKDSH